MINQDELIKGTLMFISKYHRLPYYKEDDIDVEKLNDDGEIELKPYRALKYIKEFFVNQDKYTQYLLDNQIITYKMISEIIKIDTKRLIKLLNKEVETPETNERKLIEIFFNKDYYKELDVYNEVCMGCTKQCKQSYNAKMFSCNKYRAKKINKKK